MLLKHEQKQGQCVCSIFTPSKLNLIPSDQGDVVKARRGINEMTSRTNITLNHTWLGILAQSQNYVR